MIVVDASAMAAVILREPGHERLSDALLRADAPVTHAISLYEATLAVARVERIGPTEASREVARFLRLAELSLRDLGPAETAAALDAFARYGKGRHPARLNLGDCFSYGCARTWGLPLLYVGGDFAATDIEAA